MGSVSDTGTTPYMDDVHAAYSGGVAFTQRLAQLSQAREDHQRAFDNFRIGNDAHAAYTDALRKREEAAKVLAEAQQTAASLISGAKTEADKVRFTAKTFKDSADKYAKDRMAKADQYYADKTGDANELFKKVNEQQQHLVQATNAVNMQKASLDAEMTKHKAAMDNLKKEREDHAARVRLLQDTLQRIA